MDALCDLVGVVARGSGLLLYPGGFIHLLLVIAVVVLVMRHQAGPRAARGMFSSLPRAKDRTGNKS